MSQTEKLYNLLSDSEPHSTNEIIEKVYPCEGRLKTPARISARIWDVKHKYGVEIESNPDEFKKGMWWYCIIPPNTPEHPIYRDEQLPEVKQKINLFLD